MDEGIRWLIGLGIMVMSGAIGFLWSEIRILRARSHRHASWISANRGYIGLIAHHLQVPFKIRDIEDDED
jgi:hypothetical protein